MQTMFSHRRLIGLSLAFLFLVMQALWLVHHLGHDLSSNAQGETACEFCVAMHGMGSAISGQERTFAVVPSSDHQPRYASTIRVDAQSIQPRQQGPPNFS
jgi:hypothetical protein